MSRLLVLLACIAFVAAGSVLDLQHIGEVQVVEDIDEFLAKNPDAKLIPLVKETDGPLGRTRYTLGTRIGGDRPVAQGSNSFTYPRPQDVQLRLTYPETGISGAVITFLDVWVDQSSTVGRAYLIGGGIGQRFITFVVEAKSTTFFAYTATIYGY